MRIKPFFRWYDAYVGAYYDRRAGMLYLVCMGFGLRVRIRTVEPYFLPDLELLYSVVLSAILRKTIRESLAKALDSSAGDSSKSGSAAPAGADPAVSRGPTLPPGGRFGRPADDPMDDTPNGP